MDVGLVGVVDRGGRPRGTGYPDPFAALADSTRRRLLAELSTSNRTVSELASDLQISQPAVSQHLKVLRETGLVVYCCVGRSHQYRLCTRVLYEVRDWVLELEKSWLATAGIVDNAAS
jgi:DNA-binding transcriptional ArsR family regulator